MPHQPARCDHCGRPLRDRVSLAAGRGPVCRRKQRPQPAHGRPAPVGSSASPAQLDLWSHTVTDTPDAPRTHDDDGACLLECPPFGDRRPCPCTPGVGTRLTASEITDDQLEALYNERDELLTELDGRGDEARERWVQKQLDATGLRAAEFRNGIAMELEPAREMVAHWVGAARAMLGDAPNYTETPVEMEVKVGESPERFAFVLQRVAPGALTPHQARQKAERERDEARQSLDAVRGVCDALQADVRGLTPVALAGRRDAVARICAVLPPAPDTEPGPDGGV